MALRTFLCLGFNPEPRKSYRSRGYIRPSPHQMKRLTLILMAAFGLIMNAILASAQTVRSVPIPISSVPFAITAPGTYVLTGNLTTGQVDSIYQAILIGTNIQGPVVLDLKGFKLTGNNVSAISIGSGTAPNTYPITIKNGITSGGLDTNPGGVPFPATEITIANVTFLGSGITFNQVSSSTVKNCTFQEVGIHDFGSPGGNRYINLTFINNRTGALIVSPTNEGQSASVLTLEHCHFEAPAN